ncbi:MAG: ATP-binding protein [Campylobacteraceae bacterium]|nr:ATP-binding protein [Campylobacteraceae bacterium]
MEYLIDFLESKEIKNSKIFPHLKCSEDEAKILQVLVRHYIEGEIDIAVNEILNEIFGQKDYAQLQKIPLLKNIIDLGWIIQSNFTQLKLNDFSNLELYNGMITPSPTFLKLLEDGNLEMILPDIVPYSDHLEYIKDQFFRIELYQKINSAKHSVTQNAPGIHRLQTKLQLLEARINERLKVTKNEVMIETLFKERSLDVKEQIIFLALLKEEYSGEFENLREMNTLIGLVSFDEYERIKNRAILEEGSRLIESGIIDYDEMFTAFGGVSRSFYINEDILQKIMHPDKEKKSKKMKLDMLIAEQDIFELIEPKTNLNDVVMSSKIRDALESILKQADKVVVARLKEWGIKDKRKGIDAKIILYGPPGTGKTMTALSLAKSLKKQVLNFDCSKILSKYVGESEKNVRNIFDTYRELCYKTKTEPLLLLNEADQFLSARSSESGASADKMHNQMQNIFLEQIERFDGLLVATTNMLENIDPAFSRRFDYKIEFEKPNLKQRIKLWQQALPESAAYEENFDIKILAGYPLSGGQIQIVLKNTALKVALKKEAIFTLEDFKEAIERETKGAFGESNSVGFLKQ